MTFFETAHTVHACKERCEDRVEILRDCDRTLIVVADGAGGTGSGHLAAEAVIREVQAAYSTVDSSTGWADFLSQLDFRISTGETTAVIVDLRPDRILGASVGDSRAQVIEGSEIVDLTRTQNRKPLLGSHAAKPTPFWHQELNGILVVGSDGFFDYAKTEQLTPMISRTEFFAIPRFHQSQLFRVRRTIPGLMRNKSNRPESGRLSNVISGITCIWDVSLGNIPLVVNRVLRSPLRS